MLKHIYLLGLLAAAFSATASAQNPTFQYANASVLTTSAATAEKGNLAVAFKETGIGSGKDASYSLSWTGRKEVWGCAKNGKLNNGQPYQVPGGSGASSATAPVSKSGWVTSTIYSNLTFAPPAGFSCPSSFTAVLTLAEYYGVTLRQVDGTGATTATANVNCGSGAVAGGGCTVTGNVAY